MKHTAAFLLLKLKGSLLVRSGAVGLEARGCCILEACAVADTREVGTTEVNDVREIERS